MKKLFTGDLNRPKGKEAARWLAEDHDLAAIGNGARSLDCEQFATEPPNTLRQEETLENVVHLARLPECAAVIALPN